MTFLAFQRREQRMNEDGRRALLSSLFLFLLLPLD